VVLGDGLVLAFVDGLVFADGLASGAVAPLSGLVDGLELLPGDSLGEDMTGLESGFGVGLVDACGLPVSSSGHGLAVVAFLLVDDVADGDVDALGLVLGEAETVVLGDAETVGLAVAEPLGVAVAEGEPDGELEGEVDGVDEGAHDGTGATAGACDSCPASWVAAGWLPAREGDG
jgi:hypothetical protein